MANFLRKTADVIGKAIPNEFGKLNSFAKFLPPPFNVISQSIAATDAGATAYGDTGSIGTGVSAGFSGFTNSQDPGQYGSGYTRTGQVTPGNDIFNTLGNVGNMFGGQSGEFDTNQLLNMFGNTSQASYQPDQNEMMMRQIRSLYAQYLFSQNQAALSPATSPTITYNRALYG